MAKRLAAHDEDGSCQVFRAPKRPQPKGRPLGAKRARKDGTTAPSSQKRRFAAAPSIGCTVDLGSSPGRKRARAIIGETGSVRIEDDAPDREVPARRPKRPTPPEWHPRVATHRRLLSAEERRAGASSQVAQTLRKRRAPPGSPRSAPTKGLRAGASAPNREGSAVADALAPPGSPGTAADPVRQRTVSKPPPLPPERLATACGCRSKDLQRDRQEAATTAESGQVFSSRTPLSSHRRPRLDI